MALADSPISMRKRFLQCRSVRDKDVRRDGLRRSSESLRDAKSTKQKRLPSWLGDKHEESNEWFYMDPKVCSVSLLRDSDCLGVFAMCWV